MLTREQIQTLIAIRNRPGSVFNPKGTDYRLPTDLIKQIAAVGFNPDPNSDIAILLHHVAYGDLDAVKAMLDANPSLIGKASHVVTPSGLKVRYVKPYECALGAGDYDMALLIARYFPQFADGLEEKASQDAKYRQSIDNMLNEQPYDFTWIMDVIKNASDKDVYAELELKKDCDSTLHDCMEKFRQDYSPDKTTAGRMHFRFIDVIMLLRLMDKEWMNLSYSQRRLVCNQLFGYVERNFPAFDRMECAQNYKTDLSGKYSKKILIRTFDMGLSSFPITADDTARSGLGFHYFILDGSRHAAGSYHMYLQDSYKQLYFINVMHRKLQIKKHNLHLLRHSQVIEKNKHRIISNNLK